MAETLVIAAHPDDETLMCGGVIAGSGAHVVVLSTGVTSRGQLDHRATSDDLAAACKVLGATFEQHALPDQRLDSMVVLDITQRLERIIADHGPRIIYTHHPADVNRDHRIVFESVLTATRLWRGALYACEVPGSMEWAYGAYGQFQPNTFRALTPEQVQAKIQALLCYRDEVRPAAHPRSTVHVLERMAYWGRIAGTGAAEAFQLIKDAR